MELKKNLQETAFTRHGEKTSFSSYRRPSLKYLAAA